ncbi:MAG: porin family protein [Planctomycetales bacterium]|nr:porin family protein [Planctomycetales bacterium]
MRFGQVLLISIAFSISGIASVSAQNCKPYYLSGTFAGDFLSMEASGRNTAGGFDAMDHEHETNSAYGFAIGREWREGTLLDDYQLRYESQYLFMDDSQFDLGSFPGPPGPYSFLYQSSLTNRWASMSNIWIDKAVSENFEVYAGGGIGISLFEFEQTDGVVSSTKDDEDVAYQFGVGLNCRLLSNVELDFGYRHMNLGNANTNLTQAGGAVPAGNLNVDLDSDQIALTLRIYRR